MNIHPLMCEALMSLPSSEETSGEVTILLESSPEVSNYTVKNEELLELLELAIYSFVIVTNSCEEFK